MTLQSFFMMRGDPQAMNILESKLNIPDLPPVLNRDSLFAQLDRSLGRSLICITGGSGYGKTTLLASYVRTKELPTLWYQLTSEDNESGPFLQYVLAGLQKVAAHAEIATQPTNDRPDAMLDDLLKALASWASPLAIVLDDYHFIDSCDEIKDIILKLIRFSSPHVTVMISSRVRPSLPLLKLKVQNRLLEISMDQLAFSREEVGAYFTTVCGMSLMEHELDLLLQKTSGWAVLLPLIHEVIREKSYEERKQLWRGISPPEEVFEYVGGEVIRSLPNATQEFLLKASLLQELDPEVLLHYIESANTGPIIGTLLKDHLFVYKTPAGAFQFYPIVRAYLYERLLKQYGKKAVCDLHAQVAQVYEKKNQYFHAFSHYISGRCFALAAQLLRKMTELYTPERFLLLLNGSIDTLCPTFPTVTFNLFFCRCIPIPILRTFIGPLEDSITTLSQGSLSAPLTYLQNRLGLILFYSGEMEKAKRHFRDSLDGSEKLHDQDLVSLNYSCLAQCCRFTGDFAHGLKYARLALTNSEEYGAFNNLTHTFWVMAELFLEQQEFDKAERLLEEMVRFSEEYEDVGARVYPLISIGKLYRLQGNYEHARAWMMQGLEQAQKSSLDTDLGWALMELGLTHLAEADYAEAEACMQKAASHFRNYGHFQQITADHLAEITALRRNAERPAEPFLPGAGVIASDALTVHVLGSFQMKLGDKPISLQRKASLRLFQYLLIHYGKKVPQDLLLEELFTDGDYQSKKNRFFVSLSTLRKALEPTSQSGRESRYILQAKDSYYLNMEEIDLDLARFSQLITQHGATGEERLQKLQQAAALYHGDLLAEFPYESFIEPARERLKHSYLQVLLELAEHHWKQMQFTAGIDYFERILACDPYAEQIHYRYISLLLHAGFVKNARSAALKLEKSLGEDWSLAAKAKVEAIFREHSG